MNIQEYQEATKTTAGYMQQRITDYVYDSSNWNKTDYLELAYLVQGLASEAGEVAGLSKKLLRDLGANTEHPVFLESVKEELGDVLWYISEICNQLGFSIETIMEMNIKKLQDRKERNVLGGSGDHR
jgi:NTP pyrophosphatase (non-canonical NTP hydrolase)